MSPRGEKKKGEEEEQSRCEKKGEKNCEGVRGVTWAGREKEMGRLEENGPLAEGFL